MSAIEVVYSVLPLAIMIAFMVFLVRKTGAFEQKKHRARVEELLERIAVAVEKKQ